MTRTEFKRRKVIITTGAIILAWIMMSSSVASFIVYRGGFIDNGQIGKEILGGLAALVMLMTEIWLIYGITTALASGSERVVCMIGIAVLLIAGSLNVVTSFMILTETPLIPFQLMWLKMGGIVIFLTILILVVAVWLAEPTKIATQKVAAQVVNTTRQIVNKTRHKITYR